MRPLSIIYLYQNCGLYLRAACINYFSSYLRLVFEGRKSEKYFIDIVLQYAVIVRFLRLTCKKNIYPTSQILYKSYNSQTSLTQLAQIFVLHCQLVYWIEPFETNGDLKICLYLCFHMNIICRRFHIITPFIFWDIRTWDIWNVCL